MPLAIVSVTNDLTTDQRVDRTCQALVKSGYEVLLVGRRRKNSATLKPRSYRVHRLRLLFEKGPWFYAEYNVVLFFYLLVHRSLLLVSNDLDTLAAVYLAARLKTLRIPSHPGKQAIRHIHDCHEYFRGVPELVGRKTVTKVWKWIEDRIFPRLEHVMAVNNSVAGLYAKEYGNKITVIRNVPFRKSLSCPVNKATLKIRDDQKVILYQGAVNIDRGLEEAILAMKHLETDAILVIAGTGDIFDTLKIFIAENGLTEKVRLTGEVPFQELHSLTLMADLGLSIEKDVSINYHYCLPNKFLDYIQANIPVLVSPFPEMKSIVDKYVIGDFVESHQPESLAVKMDSILKDHDRYIKYKKNLLKAAEELCWENEEKSLLLML